MIVQLRDGVQARRNFSKFQTAVAIVLIELALSQPIKRVTWTLDKAALTVLAGWHSTIGLVIELGLTGNGNLTANDRFVQI